MSSYLFIRSQKSVKIFTKGRYGGGKGTWTGFIWLRIGRRGGLL
jgi:hypothetical protein